MAERHDLLPLLAFPTSRAGWARCWSCCFPYVRAEGLGRAFNGEAGRVQVVAATGIVTVVVGVLGPALILPALGTAAVVLGFAFWMHRRLGGLTGDVYGAAIELGEVVMLVFAGAIADALDAVDVAILATCCYGRSEWLVPRSFT